MGRHREGTHIGSWTLALLWLVGPACARLPDYAAPQAEMVDPASVDQSNLIPYRGLTRADFQGTQLPGDAGPYAERIGALTCAQLFTTPSTGMLITEHVAPDGTRSFEGKLQNVGFMARMDRNCSWWNPNRPTLTDDYVLQHEQIHFAIVEAEARRLNLKAQELSRFSARGDSQAEVQAACQAELDRQLQQAMENLQERNHDFDRDTSGKYDPAAQARWYDELDRELRALPPAH